MKNKELYNLLYGLTVAAVVVSAMLNLGMVAISLAFFLLAITFCEPLDDEKVKRDKRSN